MVEVTGRNKGFLVLLALAVTTDGGLRGSGKRTARGEWSQTKVNYPISLYLYLQLHVLIETYIKKGRKVQGEGRRRNLSDRKLSRGIGREIQTIRGTRIGVKELN